METTVKFNTIDEGEDEWMIDEYANGKIGNLTDEHLTEVIAEIISDAILANGMYYLCEHADNAAREILPTISAIILNPRFSHIRNDYNLLIEMVTYLTFRLA